MTREQAQALVFLLDTITGKAWILRDGVKPVWVEISTASRHGDAK